MGDAEESLVDLSGFQYTSAPTNGSLSTLSSPRSFLNGHGVMLRTPTDYKL